MNRKILYSIHISAVAIIISFFCYSSGLLSQKTSYTNAAGITWQQHSKSLISPFGSFQQKQKDKQKCTIRIKAWDDAFAIDVPTIWTYFRRVFLLKKFKVPDYESNLYKGDCHLTPLRGPPAYTV